MNPSLTLPRRAGGFERTETDLPGVCLIAPAVVADARGFFAEIYRADHLAALGIADVFVQDNHSRSRRGTLRGLHAQLRRPQAKLCRVTQGEVLDVAVDIRVGSPHFGRHVAVHLSAESWLEIYVPRGFAHGFLVLSDYAEFQYKCSDFYDAADEIGVLWNDPALAIPWGVTAPELSAKDRALPCLAEIPPERLPRFEG